MKHTSSRLNTLDFVLRCLWGRPPTHVEKVCAYARMLLNRRSVAGCRDRVRGL